MSFVHHASKPGRAMIGCWMANKAASNTFTNIAIPVDPPADPSSIPFGTTSYPPTKPIA